MRKPEDDDLRPEYDLDELKNKAVGKHYESYNRGVNAVVIDPDLVESFPDAKAVNDALRELLARRKNERT